MARRSKKQNDTVELPSIDEINKPKRKRSSKYSKTKGNAYEVQIAKELRELGFDTVTARSESKNVDNNKVDIIDKSGKLPVNIQLKKTLVTPQYFKIREESTVDPETFCLIWAKQEKKEVNICTVGEVCMIPKSFFYKLLKVYSENSE